MWLTQQPTILPSGKENWYPFYRRLGGPPRTVRTVAQNLAPFGIRPREHPVRCESMYWMSCPGLQLLTLRNVVIIFVGYVEKGTGFTSVTLISYVNAVPRTHVTHQHFPSLKLGVGRGSPASEVSWRTTEHNNIIRRWLAPLRRPVTIVGTSPKLQAGGTPFFGCLRLSIQHVSSYRHFLKACPPIATWEHVVLWW